MAYLLSVFCFVLLLFTVFICMYVFLFLFFATTSLVNKDLYKNVRRKRSPVKAAERLFFDNGNNSPQVASIEMLLKRDDKISHFAWFIH